MDVTPLCREVGIAPHSPATASTNPPEEELSQRGGSRQDLQPQSSRTLSRMEIPAGSAAVLFVNKNGYLLFKVENQGSYFG